MRLLRRRGQQRQQHQRPPEPQAEEQEVHQTVDQLAAAGHAADDERRDDQRTGARQRQRPHRQAVDERRAGRPRHDRHLGGAHLRQRVAVQQHEHAEHRHQPVEHRQHHAQHVGEGAAQQVQQPTEGHHRGEHAGQHQQAHPADGTALAPDSTRSASSTNSPGYSGSMQTLPRIAALPSANASRYCPMSMVRALQACGRRRPLRPDRAWRGSRRGTRSRSTSSPADAVRGDDDLRRAGRVERRRTERSVHRREHLGAHDRETDVREPVLLLVVGQLGDIQSSVSTLSARNTASSPACSAASWVFSSWLRQFEHQVAMFSTSTGRPCRSAIEKVSPPVSVTSISCHCARSVAVSARCHRCHRSRRSWRRCRLTAPSPTTLVVDARRRRRSAAGVAARGRRPQQHGEHRSTADRHQPSASSCTHAQHLPSRPAGDGTERLAAFPVRAPYRSRNSVAPAGWVCQAVDARTTGIVDRHVRVDTRRRRSSTPAVRSPTSRAGTQTSGTALANASTRSPARRSSAEREPFTT